VSSDHLGDIEMQAGRLYPNFERVPRSKGAGKYRAGFMDRTGAQVVDFIYEDARPFYCGLATVKTGGKWGAVDASGRMIIEPISGAPLGIGNDRVIYFGGNGKRGIMSLNGAIILEPTFRILVDFQEDASWMSADRLYGFVARNGLQLIPPIYEDARSFSDGVAPVKLVGGKWGYVNKFREFEIPPRFDFALPFSEGLARFKEGELWGYINRQGEVVIRPQYGSARDFREGLADVEIGRRWGYINQAGEVVIPLAFQHADGFFEGVAAVSPHADAAKRDGFINREGVFVIPPLFERASRFRDGLSLVETEKEIQYIDMQGDVVWRGRWVELGRISEL
jgi:hypothetical protein